MHVWSIWATAEHFIIVSQSHLQINEFLCCQIKVIQSWGLPTTVTSELMYAINNRYDISKGTPSCRKKSHFLWHMSLFFSDHDFKENSRFINLREKNVKIEHYQMKLSNAAYLWAVSMAWSQSWRLSCSFIFSMSAGMKPG